MSRLAQCVWIVLVNAYLALFSDILLKASNKMSRGAFWGKIMLTPELLCTRSEILKPNR